MHVVEYPFHNTFGQYETVVLYHFISYVHISQTIESFNKVSGTYSKQKIAYCERIYSNILIFWLKMINSLSIFTNCQILLFYKINGCKIVISMSDTERKPN